MNREPTLPVLARRVACVPYSVCPVVTLWPVGEAVGARRASSAGLWCRRELGVRASGHVCLVFHFFCAVQGPDWCAFSRALIQFI